MYYVYVLRDKASERWYTGYTSDLQKRLTQHNLKLSSYTKGRGPYELIYYEGSVNKLDAMHREKYLKLGMGKRYIKNRVKRFLALTG